MGVEVACSEGGEGYPGSVFGVSGGVVDADSVLRGE